MDTIPYSLPPYLSPRARGRLSLEERVDAFIEKTCGCWIWHGNFSNQGYPRISVKCESLHIHRYIYERFIGPVGVAMIVRRTCQTPACVKPDHLILRTEEDHHRDAAQRGRDSRSSHAMCRQDCSVAGCPRFARASGLCTRHYQRQRKYGDPMTLFHGGWTPTPAADRFWEKVYKTDYCWIWAGARNRGYGKFTTQGFPCRTVSTHKYAWELLHGPVPPGLQVCHNCPEGDNTLCVRPDHMFLGTAVEHGADRVAKGQTPKGDRHYSRTMPERMPRGSRSGMSKLTEQQVFEIRARYARGDISQQRLAKEYGVFQTIISSVVRRKTWRHVP